jgi:hypothetical protein
MGYRTAELLPFRKAQFSLFISIMHAFFQIPQPSNKTLQQPKPERCHIYLSTNLFYGIRIIGAKLVPKLTCFKP